jgi:D-alanyl-D-alanine-carboxypeptidase/D-alanyl-D-alanine-endopeptidase
MKYTKKLPLILLMLITFNKTFAQAYDEALQSKLVASYNDNDYKTFYSLGSNEWQSKHKLDGITGWLNWMHGQTGQITGFSYVRQKGDYQLIRWEGQHKVIAFVLKPGAQGQYNDFGFDPFKEPVSATEMARIKSDNSLKTAFDSSVNKVVSQFIIYNKPIGLSIGLIRDGKLYSYNYGTVAKGKQELPTSRSFYEIGSIIKTFTALLLAKAVEDHKLNLQDDIRTYLKGNYDNLQYSGQPLRIINLADYTSALPPVQILRHFDESTPESAAAFFKDYTIPQFLEDVQKVKLDTLPGTRYTYSTAALNLLAYILTQVYHKPFPDLVKEIITRPMGMGDTKLYLSAADRKRFPVGYNANGEQPDIYGPLDSLDLLHSTVHDMLIYLKHQIDEDSPAIRLSHQQFSNSPGEEAGLGWFLYKTPYGKAIGKGGNSVHMSCRAWVVPEKKSGVIVFTNYNQMDWGDLVDDLMAAIVKTP